MSHFSDLLGQSIVDADVGNIVDAEISGSLSLNGAFITSSLISNPTNTYDLGSATNQWGNIYSNSSTHSPLINVDTIDSYTASANMTISPEGNLILSPGGTNIQCNRNINLELNDLDNATNIYYQNIYSSSGNLNLFAYGSNNIELNNNTVVNYANSSTTTYLDSLKILQSTVLTNGQL